MEPFLEGRQKRIRKAMPTNAVTEVRTKAKDSDQFAGVFGDML